MASVAPKSGLIRSVDALKINPLTRLPVGQGQHIYAYSNVRTNQVLYSLTQVLRPHRNLRQLPDAGNNTKPPKLRKDHWRPLWTLTLPTGFEGEAQGLEAWRRLNALRYMHEIYWTPPKELSRVRTEEELKQIQDRIDDRGGSKKENVYDVIKRNKKKLRLKGVMDQKANSIADLAAVLVEQEAISGVDPGEYKTKQVNEMLRLNDAAQEGALAKLEAEIERLTQRIKGLVKLIPELHEQASSGRIRNQRVLRKKARHALRGARSRKEQIEHALATVSGTEGVEQPADMESEQHGQQAVKAPQEAQTRRIQNTNPKGPVTIRKPGFSMEGVKVTWQNIMDAEFASTWPVTVQHEWMGITRHAAPKPGAEPMMSAQEYMDGKRRPKKIQEDKEADVRDDVVKTVSAAIIRQLIGKSNKREKGKKAIEDIVVEREAQKGEGKEIL